MATIEKRGNSYRITVSVGYGLDGKQQRSKMTWAPDPGMSAKQIEKELNRQAVLFEEKCKTGQFISSSITLAEFIEIWFRDYAKIHLRKTAYARYQHLTKRILPALGHIRLDRLRPHQLVQFYNQLQEGGIRSDTKYLCKFTRSEFMELLSKHGYTKKKLAEVAGVGCTVLRSVTQGKRISEESALKICTALKLPIKKLFIATDPDKKLSEASIKYYHIMLSSVLTTAVQWQVIASNPCDRVKPPALHRREMAYLDDKETARLLALLDREDPMYRTMIHLLIYTGLRRAELMGLEWQDINLSTKTLRVQRSSLYLPGEGIFSDDLKTEASRRTIHLSAGAVSLLTWYKAHQKLYIRSIGDRWHSTDRLFTTWCGEPLLPDNLSRWFRRFVRQHDLPQVTIHGLRHTNASLMIAGGVDIETVAGRLGHTEIATTKKYLHRLESADIQAADSIDKMIQPYMEMADAE